MQRLRAPEDRENVLKEWAASEGITFQYRRDGAYVAIREGEEYIIQEPDPDYVPPDEDQDDVFRDEYADAQ